MTVTRALNRPGSLLRRHTRAERLSAWCFSSGPGHPVRVEHDAPDLIQLEGLSLGDHRFLSAADIPGENNAGPVIHDEPLLPSDETSYPHQPVGMVLCSDRDQARRVARSISQRTAIGADIFNHRRGGRGRQVLHNHHQTIIFLSHRSLGVTMSRSVACRLVGRIMSIWRLLHWRCPHQTVSMW